MFGIEKEIHYDSYQRDNKNFETVLEQYKKGLDIERAAIRTMRQDD